MPPFNTWAPAIYSAYARRRPIQILFWPKYQFAKRQGARPVRHLLLSSLYAKATDAEGCAARAGGRVGGGGGAQVGRPERRKLAALCAGPLNLGATD